MHRDAPAMSAGSGRAGGALARLPVVATALAVTLMLALLALPVVALLLRVSPGAVLARLGERDVRESLALSLATSATATALVALLGTPLAWVLATRRLPAQRVIDALVLLPMVLPPTVAGFALLLAFGRAGLAGRALSVFGLSLPFTTAAVVIAQVFMAAPFFIASARAGFAAVDVRYREAAATLRAGEWHTFVRVALPLSRRALVAGLAMSGARALGEFGATIVFAGNLPGVTRTMPLAVYVAMESDLDAAVALSLVLLVMAFVLLLGLRMAPADAFGSRRDA